MLTLHKTVLAKMKYPVGIQTFERLREGDYVYVDKTGLIYDMVQESAINFLSRPRRFGKSLLISTLKAYFEGRKDLFEGLKIASLEKEWKEYPIFHIDFNGNNFLEANTLQETIESYVASWEDVYGKSKRASTLGDRFAYVLQQAHEQKGQRCVVLIDEYDKPMLDVLDSKLKVQLGGQDITLEDYNRETLKAFYSVFKKADADLQFVMLTGVTKFSQVSVFSGFNQPNDLSMVPKYDTLCGITEEELTTVFHEPIHELALSMAVSDDEMVAILKDMYDGYHFSKGMKDIYNPFSLLKAFSNLSIDSYWFQSGTPTYLIRLLNHTKENVNELTGKYYDASQFVDYKADVEMPLPMIYQSGYLTIKKARRRGRFGMSYLLDFPNTEVKKGFLTLLANNYFQTKEDSNSWLGDVVDALENGDTEAFRKQLTAFLASIPYTVRRKDNETERERYFQYTVYLLMRMISCYTVYIEKEQSQGRADSIVETDDYVYIFEYKLDHTAAEAIAQIDERGYAREYANDSRRLFKIGCAFSSETGTVDDWACEEVKK